MKTKYTFSGQQKLTATFVSGEFIWLAFYGVKNKCTLYKSSIYNPNLIYWNVTINADEIKSIIEDTTYLYLAINNSSSIGAKVQKSAPSSRTYFTKHVSLIEESIDLTTDGTYIYFLLPGNESGLDAKIGKYNKTNRNYAETIILTGIKNAKKIDIDYDGNFWIVSDLETIPKVTKLWYDGDWQQDTTILS